MSDTHQAHDGPIPLHPLVQGILETVKLPEESAARGDLRLEAAQVKTLTVDLRERRKEAHVFVSLCLAAARLAHAGLPTLAAQLTQLARLGLHPDAVDQAIEKELALRKAADSLRPASAPSQSAIRAPTARGAGLRAGSRPPSRKP